MKVEQIIVDKVVQMIDTEKGLTWCKEWSTGLPKNHVSKKEYRGLNVFLTMLHQQKYKLGSNLYLSFKQINTLGGQIKPGSKGTPIIYYRTLEKKVKRPGQEDEEIVNIPLLRYYTVFNIEQTNLKVPEKEKKEHTPIEEAEQIINKYTPELKAFEHFGSRAYYQPSEDKVVLPKREDFQSIEAYYSTAFHELAHSTGAEKRLGRKGILELNGFGSETYSREELVAELTALFLSAKVGIEHRTIKNSSAYLKGWLKEIKEKPSILFKTMNEAQKAKDFITKEVKGEVQTTSEVVTSLPISQMEV